MKSKELKCLGFSVHAQYLSLLSSLGSPGSGIAGLVLSRVKACGTLCIAV